MSTLADMLLILGTNAQAELQRYLATVNLSTDFVGPAPLGSWLERRMQVVRVTRSLVFALAR
jgi:acyl-coenzyme A thioesterase PaaI-like protein